MTMKQNQSENEPIPVILPNNESQVAESERKSRLNSALALATVFLALLLVTAGVIFLLPNFVGPSSIDTLTEKSTAGDSNKTAEIKSFDQPSTSPKNDAQTVSSAQSKAQQSSAQFLRRKAELDAQNVEKWAHDDYLNALAVASKGDGLIRQRQNEAGITAYQEATSALEALSASKPERLSQAIEKGRIAVGKGEGEEARLQFGLALAIDPSNTKARQGLARAQTVEQVTALLRSGAKQEKNQRLVDAKTAYQQAFSLDPGNDIVREALSRVDGKIAGTQFQQAMNEAFFELENKRFSAAAKVFKRALRFDPTSQAAKDAWVQANEGQRLARISQYQRKAGQFEKEERWEQALDQYRAALTVDSSLEFAQKGEKRSKMFADLTRELDYNLSHPGRLSSREPAANADQLLAKVASLNFKGPELGKKTAALEHLLRISRTRVSVRLQSDGKTDVVIYRVGKFGKFFSRQVDLRPGTYIAVGACDGYRDVRRQFTVTVDSQPNINIHCEERI